MYTEKKGDILNMKIMFKIMEDILPFHRGSYGEIQLNLPQTGTPFEETTTNLISNTDLLAKWVLSGEKNFYKEQALLYKHFQNLLWLLSGDITANSDALDFFQAVMRGEAISLYPVEMNGLETKSFIPILQRTGDAEWQMGIIGRGHHAILTGDVRLVLQNAWLLMGKWLAAEVIHNE